MGNKRGTNEAEIKDGEKKDRIIYNFTISRSAEILEKELHSLRATARRFPLGAES
jgi:hypothetical protein